MNAPLPVLIIKEADEDRCPQCHLPWWQHPPYPFDATDRVCVRYFPEVSR